jgi:hypothetical protein
MMTEHENGLCEQGMVRMDCARRGESERHNREWEWQNTE